MSSLYQQSHGRRNLPWNQGAEIFKRFSLPSFRNQTSQNWRVRDVEIQHNAPAAAVCLVTEMVGHENWVLLGVWVWRCHCSVYSQMPSVLSIAMVRTACLFYLPGTGELAVQSLLGISNSKLCSQGLHFGLSKLSVFQPCGFRSPASLALRVTVIPNATIFKVLFGLSSA